MPLRYAIALNARLVTLQYEGPVTFEEWEAVLCSVFRDPLFKPGFSFLADRRASPAVSTDYIRRVVAFAKAHEAELGMSRWATVVATSGAYGMARMGHRNPGATGRDATVTTTLTWTARSSWTT